MQMHWHYAKLFLSRVDPEESLTDLIEAFMKKYNRVMLGRGSVYAKECREQGYIGADFDVNVDLSDSLYENWRDFNK